MKRHRHTDRPRMNCARCGCDVEKPCTCPGELCDDCTCGACGSKKRVDRNGNFYCCDEMECDETWSDFLECVYDETDIPPLDLGEPARGFTEKVRTLK